MNVQTVTPHAFVVYITSDELACRNLDPLSVNASALSDILSPLTEGNTVKMEVFPGRDGVLIFLRKCGGAAKFFSFDDFESMLQAAAGCPGDLPSSLYFADGRYVLAVRCWECHDRSPLSEFADEEDFSPEYILFLEEHGKVLISSGALAHLAAVFDK